MDIIYQTDRLYFIRPNINYLNDYLELVNDPFIYQYITSNHTDYTEEMEIDWINRHQNDYQFTLIDRNTNEFIGNCGYNEIEGNRGEIGIIYGSLSFYIGRSEEITNTLTGMMLQFSTYPDSIFNDKIKIIFYTIIPAGFMVYLPFKIMLDFDIYKMGIFFAITLLFIGLAYIIFYKGLKRYSSSNLMSARI